MLFFHLPREAKMHLASIQLWKGLFWSEMIAWLSKSPKQKPVCEYLLCRTSYDNIGRKNIAFKNCSTVNMDKGFLHSKVWNAHSGFTKTSVRMKFKFNLEKCAYIKPWERALSSLGFDNSLEVKGIIKFISKAFSASIVNLPAGEQVYGCKAHSCPLVDCVWSNFHLCF